MASPTRGLAQPTSPSMAPKPQVYQIDFTAVASGKRIASTKRRVRWRFGFANPEALANGETGTACRGEEHDVTIVWSITSGKRLILADGQEVHYSNSRNNIFDFSWTMKGNHVLKVVAHSSPPMQVNPGFRQYDFFVDGQSFFTFPKVYRLGLAPNDTRGVGSPHSPPSLADRGRSQNGASSYRSNSSANIAAIEAPHNPDEEEAYLREAIKNSLQDQHHPSGASVQSAPPMSGGDLLLDFDAPVSAPGPGAMTPYTHHTTGDLFGVPTPQPSYASLPPSIAPPPAQQAIDPWAAPSAFGAPTPTYGAAAPAPAIPYGAPAPPPATYDFAAPAPSPPAAAHYGGPPQEPFAPPVPQPAFASNPFGAPPQPQAPPPQQPLQLMYGQPPAPSPFHQPPPNPFGSPTPNTVSTAQDYTPASSIGFASPIAYNSRPLETAPEPSPKETSQLPTDPALMSMGVLSGQEPTLVSSEPQSNGAGGSLADQAYSKFFNMDAFDLVKEKADQKNPFDFSSSSSTNTASLSDIKKNSNQNQPKKPIMNPGPGALVLSNNQQGNFGGYGSQLGMGQQSMSGYGQAPIQQQYGQPPTHQQQQQQFVQQQAFAQQPQYGQPQMQQQQFGQPPQMQQQSQFGQQPAMQQQFSQQSQLQQPFGQTQFTQPPMQQQYGQQPWGGM